MEVAMERCELPELSALWMGEILEACGSGGDQDCRLQTADCSALSGDEMVWNLRFRRKLQRTIDNVCEMLFVLLGMKYVKLRIVEALPASWSGSRVRRSIGRDAIPTCIASASRWYCLYFVVYVLLGVYFVTNLILAVVYDSFKGQLVKQVAEKDRRRITTLQKAFNLIDCDLFFRNVRATYAV
ncbi:unnamed protein product [Ilex paraguariensis]|uniref:Ion transport domain-containing protein n=1 Tax=Ilex paraguariensis TaxID=185542 RepID=A0ABC8R1M7_9AQUA